MLEPNHNYNYSHGQEAKRSHKKHEKKRRENIKNNLELLSDVLPFKIIGKSYQNSVLKSTLICLNHMKKVMKEKKFFIKKSEEDFEILQKECI
ncbi:hypothetical protein HZS_1764 [Henneguya salminicola]|nr:hypothetical protein HZS_1764 [Henneguya salminicola]